MKTRMTPDFEMTLNEFEALIFEDTDISDIRESAVTLLRTVLSEIRPHASPFRANTPDLVQMVAGFSPTFSGLGVVDQQFVTSILTIPVFFCFPPERSGC